MAKKILLPGIAVLLALGWWCYAPGLHGTFLFDDFNNLERLGSYGGVHDLNGLLLYLTSGNADPVGRPLSLLSFLVDATDWPADPEPFKRTSILLHLLNGALLSLLLFRLGQVIRLDSAHAAKAALLGAALWTLHPFLVSTTLYVVQREAMLPATFTLCGLLLWIAGRQRLLAGKRGGAWLLLAATVGCTGLATLSKANGLLLPLLLLTLEYTLLRAEPGAPAQPGDSRLHNWRRVLLVLPSLLLGLYLLSKLPGAFRGETYGRSWTLGQRLLSEPRVLCDYLAALWLPRASGASLFNDAYPASTGWLQPWTTLPSILAIAALVAWGFILGRRRKALGFALLFYFGGQLLESSVIQLELYFEHRNYLPALPMFWPLSIWLTGSGRMQRLRTPLIAVLSLLLVLLCHSRAMLWGSPNEQALLLARVSPESPRAQANAATYELAAGRPDLAAARLAAAAAKMPDEVQLTLNWIDAACVLGGVDDRLRETALWSIQHNRTNVEFVEHWLTRRLESLPEQQCPGLNLDLLEAMTDAIRKNTSYALGPVRQAELGQLEGRADLLRGDGPGAKRNFDQGLAAYPTPDRALLQAALLGSAGFPQLGLEHLQYYRTLPPAQRDAHGMQVIHFWLLARTGYWDHELEHLAAELRQDASAAPAAGAAGTPVMP